MKREKKIAGISLTTIGILIPIIGRAIGPHIIKEREKRKDPVVIQSITETDERGNEIPEEKEEQERYYHAGIKFYVNMTMDFSDARNSKLKDSKGKVILEKVTGYKHTYSELVLIESEEGNYVVNTRTEEVLEKVEEAIAVNIKENGEKKEYQGFLIENENYEIKLYTKERCYESVDLGDGKIYGATFNTGVGESEGTTITLTTFEISGEIAVLIPYLKEETEE